MSQTKAQLLDNIKDNVQLDARNALRFADTDSSHYVALKAPATFPKGLLVLIIALTILIYYLSFKKPWKKEKELPKNFFLTLLSFIFFIIISKTLDFFLILY